MTKMTFLALLVGVAGVSTVALAQDNESAILDALKRIEGRLDTMDKRIDGLEKSTPTAAANPAGQSDSLAASKSTPPAPRGAALPPGIKAVPGWSVNVIPFIEGNPNPDAIFRFRVEKFPLKFDAHLATRKIDGWMRYRGEAKMNVYEPGRYIFQIDITAGGTWTANCVSRFLVDGKTVFETQKDHYNYARHGETMTNSGGIDLASGNYDVAFEAACTNGNQGDGIGYLGVGNYLGNPGVGAEWRKNALTVLVRGPSDDVARPFGPRELFTLVKDKTALPLQKPKADVKQPAPPAAKSAESPLPWVPQN